MSSTFTLGEVRPANEQDLSEFRNMVDEDHEWKIAYNKGSTYVATKQNDKSLFNIIKIKSTIHNVPASVVYDVLHDPIYRKVWDKQMADGYDYCLVSPNTDIGYYAIRSFPPFKNRDFVTLRSWFAFEGEYIILNHSVFHKALPPNKKYVRGISYLSGYIIRATGSMTCSFNFVSQSDPRGKIPAWAVNRGTQYFAPRIVTRLAKAAKNYSAWKAKHSPMLKPWLYPEQHRLPGINWNDISLTPDFSLDESCLLDEAGTSEDDLIYEIEKSDTDEISCTNVAVPISAGSVS